MPFVLKVSLKYSILNNDPPKTTDNSPKVADLRNQSYIIFVQPLQIIIKQRLNIK